MTQPITIRLADHRDFDQELAAQVRFFATMLKSPEALLAEVEKESQSGISYKEAWENVETRLENATGLRHYGDYTAFRVQKHRIQARSRNFNNIQLSLELK